MNCAYRSGLVGAIIAIATLPSYGNAAILSFDGKGAEFWEGNSVIVAEILGIVDGKELLSTKVRFRPVGTLAGTFDAGQQAEVEAAAEFRGPLWNGGRPSKGDMVLVLLKKEVETESTFVVPFDNFMFMTPPAFAAMEVNSGPLDLTIDKVLASIQKVRPKTRFAASEGFWKAHSVIYAQVKEVELPKEKSASYKIVLQPKVVLSGEFDAGGTPEVVATFHAVELGPTLKVPDVGSKVIVALDRSADSFSVGPWRPDFMPVDHAPICVVKDFSDPKVSETLKAVQALRKKEAGQKANRPEKPR